MSYQLDLSEITPPSPHLSDELHNQASAALAAVASTAQPPIPAPTFPAQDLWTPDVSRDWAQPPITSDMLTSIFPPTMARRQPPPPPSALYTPQQPRVPPQHFAPAAAVAAPFATAVSQTAPAHPLQIVGLSNAPPVVKSFPPAPSSPTLSSSATADGLNAVERAKKSAEDFTRSQLAKKKRKALSEDGALKKRKGSDGSSCSDQDLLHEDDEAAPEKISHIKYQKRLQKNRDSAFVSRIRRREYTKILENSLTTTEKEKNIALSKYKEMKRKFDIVSAELNLFKQAARIVPGISADRTDPADAQPPRSSSIVTTMFMFTLMFGILLPEAYQHPSSLSSRLRGGNVMVGGSNDASNVMSRIGMPFASLSLQEKSHVQKGQVWRLGSSTKLESRNKVDTGNDVRESLAGQVRDHALHVYGLSQSQKLVRTLRNRLASLPNEQVESLHAQFVSTCAMEEPSARKLDAYLRDAGVANWKEESGFSDMVLRLIASFKKRMSKW